MGGVAQSGAPAMPGVAQAAGHGLLATLPAKIIAVVLTVVVVAGGTVGVLAATGTKLFGSGGARSPTRSAQHSPTSNPAIAPGPNGAPSDSASFTLAIVVEGGSVRLLGNPENKILVTGRSGSASSMACGPHDNGQPFSYPSPNPAITYTTVSTCTGSYQNGKLTYTQMILRYSFSGQGATCTVSVVSPWVVSFQGTFTSPTTISGTATATHGAEPLSCAGVASNSFPVENDAGPWSGTIGTTS
jgi:hypothetical protein